MKRKILVAVLAFVLIMINTVTVAIGEAIGNGGGSYAGASTNTFAQNLNLADIYINPDKIRQTLVKPEIVSGPVESGRKGMYSDDVEECTISLDATQLTSSSTNTISAEWYYIYPDAAILPNGTEKNLKITYKLKRVETGGPANPYLNDGWVLMSNGGPSDNGHNIRGGICDDNANQLPWACQSEMDISISVVDGSGSFLISLNGNNQWQNRGSNSWSALENRGTNKEFTRETVILPDENYYYPAENVTDKEGKIIYGGKTGQEDGSGKDGNYNSGFVTMGYNNYTMTIREIGAIDRDGNTQNQNMYLTLGDLQHRIWSGSDPNGKIATGRSGTGTDLGGGSFKGEITAITGEEKTLCRYVVPDCKAGVTYTMTPNKGYIIDTISVDGTLFTVPDNPATGETWTAELPSNDGGGVLSYSGNGVYTYTFANANTQDHSIYVSWKKVKEDPTPDPTPDNPDPKPTNNPPTGDHSMFFMFGGIMLLAVVIIAAILIPRRLREF